MENSSEIREGPPIPGVEKEKVEPRDDREKVLSAFNDIYARMEQKAQQDTSPLTKWRFQSVKDAKEKTIDQGKNTFNNRIRNLETGEVYAQEEGIPIEGMLDFVREEVGNLPIDSEQRKNLIEAAQVLYNNSVNFNRLPHRMEPQRLLARVRQEAYFISEDARDTGTMDGDWFKGEDTLMKRLELQIPPKKEPEPIPPESAQPSEEKKDVVTAPSEEVKKPAEEPKPVVQEPQKPEVPPSPEPAPAPQLEPEQTPEVVLQPETVEQIRRDFAIVNRTIDVRKRAAELAEEQLRNEQRRGSAFDPRNWVRKVRTRVLEEYYRQQYIERATRAMLDHNNSYLSMDVVKNSAVDATNEIDKERGAGRAKIEQVKSGELLEGQRVEEVQGELRQALMNDIIRPVISGAITNETQVQQRLREFVKNHENDPQVQAVFGRDATQYGKLAEYFASDLLESGRLVKDDLDTHRYAMEQLDEVVRIQLANTSWAAESQASFNKVDKAVAWAEQHRLTGWAINPATVGAAFSIGTFAAIRSTGYGARVAQYAIPGVGLATGALFAGLRRNYDLKVDRAAHQVERTYNREIPEDAKRRQALEKFAYNTASVNDLLNGNGQELITGTDRKSLPELLHQDLSNGQTANREAVSRRIAEIKTRLDFSASHKMDLVTFAGREDVEQGRLALVKAMVESRSALRSTGMTDEEIRELETRFTGEWNQRFTQNREQQDRNFAHYRLRNAAGAAVFGGIAGLAGGLATQEGLALAARSIPEVANLPVVGGIFRPGRTTVESAIHEGAKVVGRPDFLPPPPSIEAFQNVYQNGGSIDIGKGIQASVSPDKHLVSFIDSSKQQIQLPQEVSLKPDGHLEVNGKIDQLPQDVRDILGGWSPVERKVGPSVQELLQQASISGKPETVTVGNLAIHVEGQNISMENPVGGKQIGGIIDSNAKLHFDNRDRDALDAVRNELSKNNFSPGDVVEHETKLPSILDRVKDTLLSGKTEKFVQGDIDVTLDGKTRQLTIIDHVSNTRVVGNVSADGRFNLDMSQNVNVDFAKLKQLLAIFKVTDITEPTIPGKAVSEDVLEHFKGKNGVEKAMRILWHDNNTPMHLVNGILVGADGKELQFHHHALKDGSVDLDMSQMISKSTSKGWENWDFTVDNQYNRVAKDVVVNPDGSRTYRNFEFLVTANDAADKARDVIRVTVDPDGHGKLPTGSDLRQFFEVDKDGNLVLDNNGKPIQLARFIEVAHVEKDAQGKIIGRTILATSVGKGMDTIIPPTTPVKIISAKIPDIPLPPIRDYSLDATTSSDYPVATDFTPPPEPEAPPIIPIPVAPRFPLEALRPPVLPGSPYLERFSPTDTLASLIRFRKPGESPRVRTRTVSSSPDLVTTSELGDREEGERALSRIHETFERSPHVYITLSGAIGDVVLSSAYIEGIRQYAEKAPQSKKITLVAPSNVADLLKPLADQHGYELIQEERHKCVEKARGLIKAQDEKDAMVFDFDFTQEYGPNPIVEEVEKNNLIVHELLSTAVGLYKNDRSGSDRFSEYLGDLLSVAREDWVKLAPHLAMPHNADEIYKELKSKYQLDTSKKQVAVVVEGSSDHKRYDLGKWQTVLKQLENDTTEFNIIYDQKANHYTEEQLRQVFGGIKGMKLVTLSIPEAMVFLQKQNLVLSNDTGLAHIAVTVENGPKVISLHAYNNTPNAWVTNTERQIGMWSGAPDQPLDRIQPEKIVEKAKEILQPTPPPQPISPSPEARTQTVAEPVKPEGLLNQVNKTLSESSGETSHFETTPSQLIDYLKTIDLPADAKIEQVNAQIGGGQLSVNGEISKNVGFGPLTQTLKAQFGARLENDPNGGIKVVNYELSLPPLAELFRGRIEGHIANLNRTIVDQMNKQIDPKWEVGNLQIAGDKLAVDFKKKAE